MTPSDFISASVRGGWKPVDGDIEPWEIKGNTLEYSIVKTSCGYSCGVISIHEILLDPLAWSAVGKDRGWGDACGGGRLHEDCATFEDEAFSRQHRFLDLLQDGQTLLGALARSTE